MGRAWLVAVLLAVGSDARADEELPNAVPTVMYKRWAAAMAYGPAFERARADEAEYHPLMFGQFALRYRIVRILEVGGSFGVAGTREYGHGNFAADVRLRLRAEMAWNWFVLGSVGTAAFDPRDGWRLFVRGGLGVERRFERWAFSADAQLSRIAGNESVFAHDVGSEMSQSGTVGLTGSLAAVYYWGSGAPPLRRHGVP